ncbi:unnamed protein product [Callosobruchus maculatus]|uniref:C2HC/C3H-type domain-containing protein n=1 Tax=Callosobruchus maculatus TaxID=64391 RepID=A0A653DPV4_CALMS|nr:unnamed protein product [Callosobruchus maculatus]
MTSKLVQMQARFQQKQMQEREEKLLKLYENQQQRAFEKVRQMFDERRKAGIDRSYPLEPLKAKSNTRGPSQERKPAVVKTTSIKSSSHTGVSVTKNGKSAVKVQAVHSTYNNNNGIESFEEHRYEEKKPDILNANHEDFMLDNEEMTKLGYDETDRVVGNRNSVIKSQSQAVKKDTRSSVKLNGVTPTRSDNVNTGVKKTAKPTPPLTRSSPSPKAASPTSPSKQIPSSPVTMSSKAPSASTAQARAPSVNRPSARQTPKASAVTRDDLTECSYCGRRFAADRVQRHEEVCAKTGKKKRKAYDATKHRVQGTELEAYVIRGGGGKKSAAASAKMVPKTHEEFIAAIRAAKEAQAHLAKGGKLADLPPPPPSSNPDYVQCPHCGRRFNEAAAERHIPKCASYEFNKPKPDFSAYKRKIPNPTRGYDCLAEEADEINRMNHQVLKYVGGKISPEMETPKLAWLKRNLKKECWDKAGFFFDLPDFLTWRATDCDSRSSCSLVCKWTYEISENGTEGWNASYFQQLGLEDLAENNWRKIGSIVLPPGSPVGKGLSSKAASELGLKPGIPVGTSMIDAHAGGLGLIGCKAGCVDTRFHTRVGLICGTSTCHMAVSNGPTFVPGVWGPYKNAMIPGMHIIQYLNNVLEKLADQRQLKSVAFLTKDYHVYPDFHGNRSPIADPSLKGMYGTRHILETLQRSGYKEIKSTLICGGLSKNPIFTQSQADVVCPEEEESVLLGAAILGACASGYFTDVNSAIEAMGGNGKVVVPNKEVVDFHNKKYNVFLKMYEHQMEYRKIME